MLRTRLISVGFAVCLVGCGPRDTPAEKPVIGDDRKAELKPTITVPASAEEKQRVLSELGTRFLEPVFQEHLFGCKPKELPFTEAIGKRGRIFTFASQFPKDRAQDLGLGVDVQILSQLEPANCFSGAGSFPVHPFICELPTERRPLTGADVLAALKARRFHSAHIKSLTASQIPYPGYHPDGNDEIHNDFAKQYVFENQDVMEKADKAASSRGNHGLLQRHVAGGQLWYVLLHAERRGTYVILFAVGVSLNGQRLIGVVTQQVCHNLCD